MCRLKPAMVSLIHIYIIRAAREVLTMSYSFRRVREANIAELARHIRSSDDVLKLQQIARALHRLSEVECNDGLNPRQQGRQSSLVKEATLTARVHGLSVYYQGDPRGWPLFLYPPELAATIEYSYYEKGIGICPH